MRTYLGWLVRVPVSIATQLVWLTRVKGCSLWCHNPWNSIERKACQIITTWSNTHKLILLLKHHLPHKINKYCTQCRKRTNSGKSLWGRHRRFESGIERVYITHRSVSCRYYHPLIRQLPYEAGARKNIGSIKLSPWTLYDVPLRSCFWYITSTCCWVSRVYIIRNDMI